MGELEMKINKLLKILLYLLIIFAMMFIFNNNVYAGISVPSGMTDIYSTSDSVTTNVGGQIIWVAQLIFYTAAVIIVIVAGLKYMWAAPEAKAEIKKKMIYLVTGAVFLFAAGIIVNLVGTIAMNNL